MYGEDFELFIEFKHSEDHPLYTDSVVLLDSMSV